MTVKEAVEIALAAIDEAHDARMGFGDEGDEVYSGHVVGALDCGCELGKAYRTLARKLRRGRVAALRRASIELTRT